MSDNCSHLYFSYDRSEDNVQKRVQSLESVLITHGIECITNEESDPSEASYSRIDSCRYVVFFLTSSYIKRVAGRGDQGANDTCRMDFDYSVLKKGIHHMIPVVLEPKLLDSSEWKGSLGAALSSCLKIFDFTHDDMLTTLVREIRTILDPESADNDLNTKIRLKDGYYEGEIDEKSQPHGQGVIKYDNKAIYKGSFKHGERDGSGKYVFPNGMIYEGGWKRDKKQGNGKLTQKNGDYYDGEFYNNEKNGKGKSVIGGSIHTGQYKNGKMEGQGILKFENGNEYIGTFFNNSMHEKGCMVFHQYGTYTGDFFLNRRHGNGRMDFDIHTMNDPSRCNESQDYYDGEWEDDLRKGKGVRQFFNGDRYEGLWENDEMHGLGKTVFHNGDIYEGQYFEGKKSGKGKYTYANGNIYEGEFLNDKRHGQGVLKYKLGQVKTYSGQFINNERCGQGKAEFASGMIYTGDWERNNIEGKGQLDFSKCTNKSISETLGTTNIKIGFLRQKIRIVNVEYRGNKCISSEVVTTGKKMKGANRGLFTDVSE